MYIVFSKDGGPARHLPIAFALPFWRAFRAELWSCGVQRDPRPGDELLGVRIVSLEGAD
jgi:hypothetical protein